MVWETQCLLSFVTERVGIMSSVMTPPSGPTGGPEGECYLEKHREVCLQEVQKQ